jgi:membrane associated rhomboid family serine protease
MFTFPAGTRSLLLINVAVFALQYFSDDALLRYFALWPIGSEALGAPGFAPWQLITYSFLHDTTTPTHLLFNMLALVMFGGDVERVWGRNRFLTYYFTCVLSAGLTQVLATLWSGSPTPTIGASGGVFGLLLAFGLMFPRRTILLIFPPIPMPAWLFVTVYGVLELYFGLTGVEANVAHFAHLGGMLGGYLLIRYGRARRG